MVVLTFYHGTVSIVHGSIILVCTLVFWTFYHGTGKLKIYHSTIILFYTIYHYCHDILYMVSFDHGTTVVFLTHTMVLP